MNIAPFSHVSSERRFEYENVMEDLIPLENELRDRQQVGVGSWNNI